MFNSIIKRKKLIDRELEVYRKEKLAEITLEIAQAQEKGAKDERDYECTWHNKREKLDIEIAGLEAKKESYKSFLEQKMECYVAEYRAVNQAKDKTIEILQNALKELTSKIPTQINNITTNNK